MQLLSYLQALRWAIISFSIVLFSVPVMANIITLKNGSVIIGDVISKQEGKLTLSTSFAGEIKIKWDEIAEIKVHEPIEVYTIDGEFIETLLIFDEGDLPSDGPLITLEDGTNTETEVAKTYVASDDVSVINPEPWELGIGSKFAGLVDFGLQFNSGNTETESLATSTDLNWKRLNDRWGLQARYFKEKTNSVTTEDNWLIRSNYDYFLTDSWYTGVYGQLEQNKIANLDQRLSIGPSLGRQFWQSDETNLSLWKKTALGAVGALALWGVIAGGWMITGQNRLMVGSGSSVLSAVAQVENAMNVGDWLEAYELSMSLPSQVPDSVIL